MMKLPRWRSCRRMALQSSAQMPETNTQKLSMVLLELSLMELPLWHAVAMMVSFSKISTVFYIKPFLDTYLCINTQCTLVAQISMTTRVFICKFFSSQHGFIKDHTLINFWEKISANMSFLNFEMGKLILFSPSRSIPWL